MSDEQTQPRRKRSPSYPYINLEQAISLARILYDAEGFNFTPVSVALEHMNYSATSGSGSRILAALLQFGLLDEQGTKDEKRVAVSELCISILEAPDEESRLIAVQEAALKPDIHAELWEKWDLQSKKLPSDSNLRFSLLREHGFQKNAVDSFIAEFRETYYYAKLDIRSTNTGQQTPENDSEHESHKVSRQRGERPPHLTQVPPGMKEHNIQLIGQPMARLILPHPITARNLEHLIGWLNYMGPALTNPEDEQYDGDDLESQDELPF